LAVGVAVTAYVPTAMSEMVYVRAPRSNVKR
jgi:hypothetical protein